MCACFPIAVLGSIDTHKGELTLHHERARRMCVPVRLAPQLLDRHDDWFACANREQTNKIRRGVATIENGIKCATSLCEAMVVLSFTIFLQESANSRQNGQPRERHVLILQAILFSPTRSVCV